MAVDIDCRILGTALCWNGRSDWLLHGFNVRLHDVWELSLPLQSSDEEQSKRDHKEYWTLHSDRDQHVTQQVMISLSVLKVSVLWAADLPFIKFSTVSL